MRAPGEKEWALPYISTQPYMLPQRVRVLSHFGLKTGIGFDHYGLKSGITHMVFKKTKWTTEKEVTVQNISFKLNFLPKVTNFWLWHCCKANGKICNHIISIYSSSITVSRNNNDCFVKSSSFNQVHPGCNLSFARCLHSTKGFRFLFTMPLNASLGHPWFLFPSCN